MSNLLRITLTLIALAIVAAGIIRSYAPLATSPAHWIHVEDGVEDYDRCVRDSDGRILVEVMHATHNASAPFGVFENGAGRGDYLTREQAKRAAGDEVVRSCEVRP